MNIKKGSIIKIKKNNTIEYLWIRWVEDKKDYWYVGICPSPVKEHNKTDFSGGAMQLDKNKENVEWEIVGWKEFKSTNYNVSDIALKNNLGYDLMC